MNDSALPTHDALREMIRCAHRELKMRERNYPKLIERQVMDYKESDREIAAIKLIINFLLKVELEHYK